jgi:hypothetical protein
MHNDTLTKTLTSGAAVFGILSSLGILTLQAQAADFKPPSWRGQLLTTVNEWEFDSPPPGPLSPDGQTPSANPPNPPSPPTVQGTGIIQGTIGNDKTWVAQGSGSRITFTIPNFIDNEAMKQMWVQVAVGQGDTFTIGGLTAEDPKGVSITQPSITQIKNPLGFDDTLYDFYLATWQIYPNPDLEKFDLVLLAGTRVAEVVVDTISIPEPTSTLSFLALGTLGAGATLKRKLKSSKSSEKDNTKIS